MVEFMTSLGWWLGTWGACLGGFQRGLGQEDKLIPSDTPRALEWPPYAQIQINETLVQVFEDAPFEQQAREGGGFWVVNCILLTQTCDK